TLVRSLLRRVVPASRVRVPVRVQRDDHGVRRTAGAVRVRGRRLVRGGGVADRRDDEPAAVAAPSAASAAGQACGPAAEPSRDRAGVGGGLDRGDVAGRGAGRRSEEHTSELQSRENLVCRLLLEKKKTDSILTTCKK